MIHTLAEVQKKYNHELHVFAHAILRDDTEFEDSSMWIDSDDVPAMEKALKEVTGRRVELGFNPLRNEWFVDRIWYIEKSI